MLRGQGETEERGSLLQMVGSRINLQGNLHTSLVLGYRQQKTPFKELMQEGSLYIHTAEK